MGISFCLGNGGDFVEMGTVKVFSAHLPPFQVLTTSGTGLTSYNSKCKQIFLSIVTVIFSGLHAFTDLNLYCIRGALALFVLVSFSGYLC